MNLKNHSFMEIKNVTEELKQNARLGIYIHVPFCPHICPYCDFTKTSKFTKKDIEIFLAQCSIQFESLLKYVPVEYQIVTVYFGGGTPGLIPGKMYKPLLNQIKARFVIEELTIETNPFSNSAGMFDDLFAQGFNRVTLGVQTLCNKTLKILGRKHTAEQAIQNIIAARRSGIGQIQVDLIYGIKNGTRSLGLDCEVDQIASAGATGISGYALTLENRTAFGNSEWAEDSVASTDYDLLCKACDAAEFNQIETSNFSKFEAKHNNIYWHGLPYLGIGTGSHGFLPSSPENIYGRRYVTGKVTESWSPANDKLLFSTDSAKLFEMHFEDTRCKKDSINELLFTLLRTPRGIPRAWLTQNFGSDFERDIFSDIILSDAIKFGNILNDEKSFRLTRKEKLFGDYWTGRLVSVLPEPF